MILRSRVSARLAVADPIEDRVAVLAAQVLEHCERFRLGGQCSAEIVRHLDAGRARVGGFASTVGSRTLQLGDPGWMHATCCDQPLRDLDVPLRPGAAPAAATEALVVGVGVAAAELAVDPAVAQCLFKRLIVVETGRLDRLLLGQHEPYPRRGIMVLRQPSAPLCCIAHDQLRYILHDPILAIDGSITFRTPYALKWDSTRPFQGHALTDHDFTTRRS